MKTPKSILLVLGLFSLMVAHGARVPEQRKDASHVVLGEVVEVYQSDGEEYVGYVVKIRVEVVEKGKGLVKGHYFYAECFDRKPHKGPGEAAPGASGHSGVPKVGSRVRVFTNEKKGIYEGVYPDWYDVLPKVDEK